MELIPPEPDDIWLMPVGDRARALSIASATWDVVAGVSIALHEDLSDPFLAPQIRAMSQRFKGAGVYFYTWWTWSALAYIRAKRPASYEQELSAIQDRLVELMPAQT
jgi:hypothetical protein